MPGEKTVSAAKEASRTYVNLTQGDPAPWFRQRAAGGEALLLDKSAGRYLLLPFLYDEAAAAIREQNNQYLDPAVGQYRAG